MKGDKYEDTKYDFTQAKRNDQTKKISSVELVSIFLDKIQQVNPKINAIRQVDRDRILKEAKRCDVALSKKKILGDLHGIPFSVKDNIATKDIVTTVGVKELLHNIPSEDATVITRLKQAGAIILGKTNMPDFATAWDTDSSAYGLTRNPYHLEHNPGGSSGGEAALIAAGASPLGIATDGGGSIRGPAHFCGVAGLRPSYGLVPTTGLLPPLPNGGFASSIVGKLLTIGTMARYVDDLAYTLPMISGTDYIDPHAYISSITHAFSSHHKKLRIAFYTTDGTRNPKDKIQQAVLDAAMMLKKKGHHIIEKIPPKTEDSHHLFMKLLGSDGGAGMHDFLQHLKIKEPAKRVRFLLQRLQTYRSDISQFLSTLAQWDDYRSHMIQFMNNFDAILCPTYIDVAPLNTFILSEPSHELGGISYMTAYSLMGWPCAIIRAGEDKGLPIGVQIITKHGYDYLALHIAKQIEQALGGWQPPPKEIYS